MHIAVLFLLLRVVANQSWLLYLRHYFYSIILISLSVLFYHTPEKIKLSLLLKCLPYVSIAEGLASHSSVSIITFTIITKKQLLLIYLLVLRHYDVISILTSTMIFSPCLE
jgi:hypothetical protein